MLVSVILPNYNHSAFLHQRIKSILDQTYKNIEIIILDDYSTDNSYELLNSYSSHPKVKLIERNSDNSGSTFKQWMKGINYANGKYIWIAESDDFSDVRFLEHVITQFHLHPETILAFCNSKVIDSGGEIIDRSKNWSRVYSEYLTKTGLYDGKIFCEKYLINHCVIPNASAVIIKNTQQLKELVKVSQSYKVSGDWYLWFKLLINNKFIYLDEELNYFRTHSGTVRKQKERLIKNESLNLLKDFYFELRNYDLNLRWFYQSYFDWSFKELQWSSGYRFSLSNFKTYFKCLRFVSLQYFFYKVPRVLYLKLK